MVRFVRDRREMPAGLARAYLLVLAPAAFLAPLPLLWTEGASRKAILLYELGLLYLWWRARAGRTVRVSDAAMNAAGLLYLAWLGYSVVTLRTGLLPSVTHLLLFTGLAKLASLKRPSEARLALLVIFLLTLAAASTSTHVASILYFAAMAWVGFRTLGLLRGARGLRRGAAGESAGIRPDPRTRPRGPRGRRALHGAALLRPAAAPRALRRRAFSDRRRFFQRARRPTAWTWPPSARPSAATGSSCGSRRSRNLPGGDGLRLREADFVEYQEGVLGPEPLDRRPPGPGFRVRRRPRGRGLGRVGRPERLRPGIPVPALRDLGRASGEGTGVGADGRCAAGFLGPRNRSLQRGCAARTGAGPGSRQDLAGGGAVRGPAVRAPADRQPDRPARDLRAHRGTSAQGIHLHARPASRRGAIPSSTSCCARGRATASTSRRRRR